jgi:hypothetical protein
MAVDVFTKWWGTIPPRHARAIPGDPLCPRHGFVFDGQVTDIARNVRSTTVTTGTWSTGSTRRYPGRVREHTGTTDVTVLGSDTLLLPTTECTIVVGQFKMDTTNRNAVSFGIETDTVGAFCAGYIPFSDGVTYFDFGGQTNGVTRVQVAGLTIGDDIWCMTVGPREMAIYQNGIPRVSSAINPTRTSAGVNFQLGKHKITAPITSDLVKYSFFFIYHRQLLTKEIAFISMNPFCWVAPKP